MSARHPEATRVRRTRKAQRGLSLVELMVALVIGSVLIAGAVTVYTNSKKSYGESESIARLQETARFAMSVIETDVRMSNFWGLLKGASLVQGQANQLAGAAAVAPSAAMNICGTNFGVDLNTNMQGDNDAYVLSASRTAGCDTLADASSGNAWPTSAVLTADTLTVRRASVFRQAVAKPGILQVCSSRVAGRLMSDGGVAFPCAAFPGSSVNNLVVNSYYVDRNSQQQAGFPSLRRKMLVSIGGVPQFRDQEVIAGVEDMQVQFGIDPAGNTGIATRYVDPNGVPAGAQVVAVRIWLLVRSDVGENGFTDSRVYQYGDRQQANGVTGDLNAAGAAGLAYQPSASADATFNGPQHVRRLLISRTINVRNAMGT
jgi:type IV pilus assembly protein PilW